LIQTAVWSVATCHVCDQRLTNHTATSTATRVLARRVLCASNTNFRVLFIIFQVNLG